MPRSKSKKVESEVKAKSIEELIDQNRKVRLDTAQEYANHGYKERVYFTPGDNAEVACLATADDINAMRFEKTKKGSTSYHVDQLSRIRDLDGKEWLTAQITASSVDALSNEIRHSYDVGKVTKPIFVKRPTGFDSRTGQIVGYTTELQRFVDTYFVEYSDAQVRALQPFMKTTSLIMHTSKKKLTAPTLEKFLEPFEQAVDRLTVKHVFKDGSVA
jgi:hypothetical protein